MRGIRAKLGGGRGGLFRTVALLLSLVFALATLPHLASARSVHAGQDQQLAAGHHYSGPQDIGHQDQTAGEHCASMPGCASCLLATDAMIGRPLNVTAEAAPPSGVRLQPPPERLLRPPRVIDRV